MYRLTMMWMICFLFFNAFSISDVHANESDKAGKGLKARSGWLGVRLANDDSSSSGARNKGVKIESVFSNSPAQNAGLSPGDVILAIEERSVLSVDGLIATIKSHPPNSNIRIKILRPTGKLSHLNLQLGQRPDAKQMVKNMYLDQPAPPLDLLTVEGGHRLDLKSYQGKVVLLEFWATWCGPCIGIMPHIKKLSQKYEKQGLNVIGVSREKPAKVKAFLKKRPAVYSMAVIPPKAKNDYFISSYPTFMLIDKDGSIVELYFGGGRLADLEKRIQSLL